MSIEEFTDTTENYENRETIMEELERVSEYWYERGEENILTITCGKRGPYKITGNRPEYRMIFDEKDETVIPIEEFKEFCAEREADVEKILNEIRNKRGTEEELFEDSNKGSNISFEKDINIGLILPNSPSVESSESEISSEETTDTEEIENMALNLMKALTFGGEVNENPEEWVNEFERVTRANN